MRVVIVDGDVSYPLNSGKRLRTLNLMLKLAQRHTITYVGRCAADSEEERTAPRFLRDHGIEPILVRDPVPAKSGARFYARLALNSFSAWPYSVTSHDSEPMRRAIRAHAAKNQVDLWQLEWSGYLPMIPSDIPGPRLVMAHNVDTLIWQRFYETERNFAKRLFLWQQWRKFRAFEHYAFAAARRVVAVSEEDARLIRTDFHQPNVDVVDNGIDRAFFEGISGERNSRSILFLGALDWRPNLDAVHLMLDKIFPQVRASAPEAKLLIVGRNPPASLVQRASSVPGVELHANVPDVRPYLARCASLAVPLRIGGGSRLKILEALASGLPVVASRVGAEGLTLQPGKHYVAAEEDTMAQALLEVMQQPAVAQAQAAAARELVLDIYDWGALAAKLETSWQKCLAG